MSVGKLLGIGGLAALPVVCCAGSSVLIGLGSAALSGWLVAAGYVLVPILLFAVGAAAIVLYRHWRARVIADDCCGTAGYPQRLPS